ncbi:hypothetical protein RKD48_006644 [Streptomyces ambofaciens]
MSRYDDLSPRALWWLQNLDELDLAESCASYEVTLERVRQLHRPVEHRGQTICAECSAWGGDSTDNPPVDHDQCGTLKALQPPKEQT